MVAGMGQAETVIEVSGVCTRFGNAVVHDHVSLSVQRGEIFALVGGSGSGKSTLLREIIMLQRPQAGSIRVFGREVLDLDEEGALDLRRRWGCCSSAGRCSARLPSCRTWRWCCASTRT